MSYQVLARKWRPQTFADVVGQEHVLTALANGLTLGRIHHAYLFSGTRGVGKTTIARLLAKGLNCVQGITATPCGICENCQEIEQGRFVDLIEIDAASRTKVEDTRDVLDNVQYAPARGRFKVYLIDEVHMLSRHSFNALLKTLEEPPEHVKFLLATTDPQKLPVTVLSRCLQFHLRALDHDQIRHQLEKVLSAEQIPYDQRALQLLARAADGSMRDALSLTDQAIASGEGSVSSDTVSSMLGTLDTALPLAVIEALVSGQGESVMAQIEQCARQGVDWETLLVDMLALLHRIAMLQLLASALEQDDPQTEQRLRLLAKQIPPAELQLYYQILLTGRKELPYAPDRRMGIEMTLLRALAFHPQAVIAEPPVVAPVMQNSAVTSATTSAISTHSVMPEVSIANNQPVTSSPVLNQPAISDGATTSSGLTNTTAQLLQARTQLLRKQGNPPPKKHEVTSATSVSSGSALERLASVTEKREARLSVTSQVPSTEPVKEEAYRWRAQSAAPVEEPIATPKALRSALEHEKTPELAAKLVTESLQRDSWAADIAQLNIPKLVQQLALNSVRERPASGEVRLHVRSAQRHLNSASAREVLTTALSTLYGEAIALTIVEDDNPQLRTPLEWRQAIYEEKLTQARESLACDTHIQTVQRYFDAELDEDSIRPV